MKKASEEIRKAVSEDYARAVAAGTGCGCGCGAPVQKGVAAKLAGYSDRELASLPREAVENSFGCGNPLAFSAVEQGQVVLDLGSGAGIDLLLAAGRVGSTGRVIGVDMTDEMIARARGNIEASGFSNIEVRKGLIEDLPVESGSVDWVISNCVINLSPEKPRVFAEIARVLKKGGTMVVSDMVAEGLPREVLENAALYSSCISGAISEKEYLAGLAEAGLTDIEVLGRMVFDGAQMRDMVESELKLAGDTGPGCCGSGSRGMVEGLAGKLEGKVWSMKVRARKL
ncbi:MAG: arsenite methyltransferase [Candidatus Fermentibacter sp.]|nr:arsenite methyltransferase [Candidatus Fermentibacter sp.]